MVSYVDDIASALREGASADVWYDAPDHVRNPDDPTDPDVVASGVIDRAQSAMEDAARELGVLHDLLGRLDAAARTHGLCRTHGPLLGEVRVALARLGSEKEPEPAIPSP